MIPRAAGPRLLHTVGSLSKSAGGPTRTVTALCRELGRLGAVVELLTREAGTSGDEEPLLPTAELVTTTLTPPQRLPMDVALMSAGFRAAIRERCATQGLQLIHDNGLWLPTNHASVMVARQLGLPLIISTHGMLEPWALQHRAWKKRLAWRFYQHRDLRAARVLHATSEQEAESLRRLGLRQPIALIPNGVELAGLAANAERARMGRADTPAADPRRTALFLSRIHPVKGLLELVDAWGQVRPAGWRMVIAGPDEGGHRALVEARVLAHGLTTDFTFVGAVDGAEKTALYRSADLFVLSSFSENFGVVVAEALNHGLPVLTTQGTPWQDLPAHGIGWWVPADARSLADGLRQATALTDAERQAMGERGRDYVRRYDWQDIAQRMLAVYLWMLRQGDRPSWVHRD